jgi:hypothetical protein
MQVKMDLQEQAQLSGLSSEPDIPTGWLPRLYKLAFASSVVMVIFGILLAVVSGCEYYPSTAPHVP